MASQGDIAKFKARVSQLQRKRFQVVQYSEDPPRAKLRGRMDDDRTRRKNANLSRFNVQGADWEIREVWIDDAGDVHDEAIDPSGGSNADAPGTAATDALGVADDSNAAALTREPAASAGVTTETPQKASRRKATAKTSE